MASTRSLTRRHAAGLVFNPKVVEDVTAEDPLLHADAYLQMVIGGDVGSSPARYSNHQIEYVPGKRAVIPNEYRPVLFDWEKHAAQFKRVLVRGSVDEYLTNYRKRKEILGESPDGWQPPPREVIEAQLGILASRATKTIRAGAWTLYELNNE